MIPLVEKTERTVLVNLVDLFDADYPTNYRAWFTDSTVTRYNAHGLFPYTQQAMKEFMERLRGGQDVVWAVLAHTAHFTHVDPTMAGTAPHIGNIALQHINWVYRSAEMAIVLGEKDYWRKGYATEALTALFDHGFNRLGLHRIWSGTAATNLGMRGVFKKLDMTNEGIFKHAMFLNGQWTDVYEYAILEDEWKERRKRNGQS